MTCWYPSSVTMKRITGVIIVVLLKMLSIILPSVHDLCIHSSCFYIQIKKDNEYSERAAYQLLMTICQFFFYDMYHLSALICYWQA